MNFDTAPIAEVEEWIAPRLGWTRRADGKWTIGGDGDFDHPIIGHAMEDAIACLPPGWKWKCDAHSWSAWGRNWNTGTIEHPRSGHVVLARDELLRLAAKACQAEEYR